MSLSDIKYYEAKGNLDQNPIINFICGNYRKLNRYYKNEKRRLEQNL